MEYLQKVRVLGFGAIAGICFSIVLIFGLVALVAVALYRRRYINKPQTLDEPDSSGYIDDSIIRVIRINIIITYSID